MQCASYESAQELGPLCTGFMDCTIMSSSNCVKLSSGAEQFIAPLTHSTAQRNHEPDHCTTGNTKL